MALPRVLLADDHALVIEAMRKLLEPHCNVVGAVLDGLSLMEAAPLLKPDVVVVDIAMPLLNGLEAGRQLRTIMPAVKLVFLTMNEDPELAIEAMRERASGYLLKTSAASELFQAIQVALKGGSYVTPRIAKGMQKAFIRDPEAKTLGKMVTPRQREVIQLIAEGKSNTDRINNARYAISVARKLGATIFLLPEDLVEVKPKMITSFVASILALEGLKL